MNNNKILICNILTEFLEIAVHNIIKCKEIYPESIFVKKQKYGIAVYETIHPHLKEYISNCMLAANELAKDDQLVKFVICFVEKDNQRFNQRIVEKVTFDIGPLRCNIERDPFLLEIEKNFRAFFSKIHTITQHLDRIQEMEDEEITNFVIQIYTTETSGTQFFDNPNFQNFPWLQINSSFAEIDDCEIIPIEHIDNSSINIQIYIEKCSTQTC